MAFSGYTEITSTTAKFPKGGGGFPPPYINSSFPSVLPPNATTDITINGGLFTSTTKVSIAGSTVNTITVADVNTLIVNITTGATEGLFDVTVTDVGGVAVLSGGMRVFVTPWVDLRTGGAALTIGNAAGNDVRHGSGMTGVRDAGGMYFTGASPWSSWVKFESLGWVRGGKTLQWVYTNPTAAMMIGVASTATNETSTAQYSQFETSVYYSGATSLWGLYGNNGTLGSAGNQSQSATIVAGTYKTIFTNDGGVGGTITTYLLPSSAKTDWDDISNPVSTIVTGGTLNPNEVNIMPGIIPVNGGAQRFLAVYVS